MGKPKQYTAGEFIDAIKNSGGIVSTIAARVGCNWHTAKKYIDETPTIAKAYADECEAVLDLAESKIIMSIKDANTQDAKWYLSKKGKHRGYGDELALTGKGGGPILVVNWDANDDDPD